MSSELAKTGAIYGESRVVTIPRVPKSSFILPIHVNYVNLLNLLVLCYNLYRNIRKKCLLGEG